MSSEQSFKAFDPKLQSKLVGIGKAMEKHPDATIKLLSPATSQLLEGVMAVMASNKKPMVVQPPQPSLEVENLRSRYVMAIDQLVHALAPSGRQRSIGLAVSGTPDLHMTIKENSTGYSWEWGVGRQDIVFRDLKTFEEVLEGRVDLTMLTGGAVKGDMGLILSLVKSLSKEAVG